MSLREQLQQTLGSSFKLERELGGGDAANAVRYYREFIDLWKRADAELQPRIAEVRRRISRLADVEASRR
jgi:hypothetical protein